MSDPRPIPQPIPSPPYQYKLVADAYQKLRLAQIEFEHVISEQSEKYDLEELKEFDKSVTVMKVAFKLIKKVLKLQGFRKLKANLLKAA